MSVPATTSKQTAPPPPRNWKLCLRNFVDKIGGAEAPIPRVMLHSAATEARDAGKTMTTTKATQHQLHRREHHGRGQRQQGREEEEEVKIGTVVVFVARKSFSTRTSTGGGRTSSGFSSGALDQNFWECP